MVKWRTAEAVIAMTALALGAGGCAAGAQSGTPPVAEPVRSEDTARVLDTLAAGDAALAEGDARALLAAARMLEASGAVPADPATPDLAAVWRAEARRLGVENTAPPRGRTAGPAYREGRLPPGEAARFRSTFHAGRPAIISVQQRGGQGLDMRVTGPDGGEICRAEALGRPAECRWVPVWTEMFEVALDNDTPREARYYLVTN